MKKNIGTALALYPMPVTVVGAIAGDDPTWTLVAHVGIIGHDRVTVSLARAHFINQHIKETGKLTVNLASEAMLPAVDVAGSTSGAKESKADLFAWEAAPCLEGIEGRMNEVLDRVWQPVFNTLGRTREAARHCRGRVRESGD